MRRGRTAALVAAIASFAALARAVAARRVEDVPLCPLFGRTRVGPNWATRRGIASETASGEVDDFTVYGRDGFEPEAVHPEIRRFYERTVDYDLAYEVTWHRGFRLCAWLASFATTRLEQLNLPGRSGGRPRRLESRIARVSPSVDPRGDARVWTRTDPASGAAVFVAIYATHERDDVTYANVAVPLPRSNLSTVLRPETVDAGEEGDGVTFTTRGDDHAGLFLATPVGAFRLPVSQRFRVLPAGSAGAPRPPTDDATLVATHEMWLFDSRFLTIRYGIERGES